MGRGTLDPGPFRTKVERLSVAGERGGTRDVAVPVRYSAKAFSTT